MTEAFQVSHWGESVKQTWRFPPPDQVVCSVYKTTTGKLSDKSFVLLTAAKSESRFVRFRMRPYRRKHHSSWRTRRSKGVVKQIAEYLKPFVQCTKVVWRLEPPFPLTAKICVTVITWVLLFLPLCYFLVPPLVALFLLSYFSDRFNLEGCATRMGEFCVGARWMKRIFLPLRFLDRLTIAFFLYDYYQIIKCLRSE